MTIVFQGLLKLLKFCKIPHKLSCVITAFGVLSFMAITGFSPSVLRSGIMSLLFLAAMIFHRKADSLNSLGIAVFLLCVINPYAAADFGFLLSVTSALSLILLSKPCLLYTSGICYTSCVQYGLPHGYFDRPVDILVTENYIRRTEKKQ